MENFVLDFYYEKYTCIKIIIIFSKNKIFKVKNNHSNEKRIKKITN